VGGLSAHADQSGLMDWYRHFKNRPPLALVHGEPDAMDVLSQCIVKDLGVAVVKPRLGDRIDLLKLTNLVCSGD
jgi:metallo-beta-lactamase family protein